MLEAKIHKEITEYEGKIFFGMTGKQIICVLTACVINIPLFFLLYKSLGVEITGYICIIVAAPIIAIGFFKYKGVSFTTLVRRIFRFYIKNQKLHCVNIIATDYLSKGVQENEKRNKNSRKTDPGYEYIETKYRNVAGEKKQLQQKRKEIRDYFTAFKKESVLQ